MGAFEGNFRQLGRFDIADIKARISALSDADWTASTWRQETFEAHRQTEAIGLIFTQDHRSESPTKFEKYFELNCDELLEPFLDEICDYFTGSGYLVRASLIRLLPKGVIASHVDAGPLLTVGRRVHLPVVTNDRVIFTVGGEALNMREGELWEINNLRVHSVENGSDDARIHLVVDWVVT